MGDKTGRWLAACGLALLAAGCTNAMSQGEREELSSLTELAARFPGAAPLIEQVHRAAVERTDRAYVISQQVEPWARGSPWRDGTQGIAVRVSRDNASSFDVAPLDRSMRIGVRRMGAMQAQAVQLDRSVGLLAPDGSVETYLFAADRGIEELVLLRDDVTGAGQIGADREQPAVAYELSLPAGYRLRHAECDAPIAEIVDGTGVPRVRMVAERAWDQTGQSFGLKLNVEGERIEIAIEGAPVGDVLVDPLWQDAGEMSAVRFGGTATLLPNGRILIAGGSDTYGPTETAELYDPLTGTLQLTGSMNEPRYHHTATLLRSGLVLIAGGELFGSDPALVTAELYDPATGEFRSTGRLVHGRSRPSVTLLPDGDVLFVGGGNWREGLFREVPSAERYGPEEGQFLETARPLVPRTLHTATLLPTGRVLIAGGYQTHGDAETPILESLVSAELYDPASGTFSPTGSMNAARAGASAVLLPQRGAVLVAGGFDGPTHAAPAVATAELYDLSTGSFSPTGAMASERCLAPATLLPNGRVLVAGGALTADGPVTPAAEVYDPAVAGFGGAGMMPRAGCCAPATLLPGGKVLLMHGAGPALYDGREPRFGEAPSLLPAAMEGHSASLLPDGTVFVVGRRSTAEVYDPAHDQYASVEGQGFRRMHHTATTLADGRVLLLGGYGLTRPVSEMVVYDWRSQQASVIGELIHPRYFHTATLLPDGRVLVAGGLRMLPPTNDPELAPEAEVVDPGTGESIGAGEMVAPRWLHTAALTTNGEVLHAGGFSAYPGSHDELTKFAEFWSPETSGFRASASHGGWEMAMVTARALSGCRVLFTGQGHVLTIYDTCRDRFDEPAFLTEQRYYPATTLLRDGSVLIAGGLNAAFDELHDSAEIYDPGSNTVRPAGHMHVPRALASETLLAGGRVLLLGGIRSADFDATATGEIWEALPPPDEAWRPTVLLDEGLATPGDSLLVAGTALEGVAEASGGNCASPTNYPLAMWQPVAGPPVLGAAADWSATSTTWTVPSTAHPGPGFFYVVVNGIASKAVPISIGRALQGAPCLGDGACHSGLCRDGVCCESSCDGICVACSAAGKGGGADGTCGPVSLGSDPDEDCVQELPQSCGNAGDCDGSGACRKYPDRTECGVGLACFEGECRSSWCDGDHTVWALDALDDCSPYRCSVESGRCLNGCTSSAACVTGAYCTAEGRCEALLADGVPGCAPACTLGTARRARPGSLLTLLLLHVALWARRRRSVGI